MQHPRTTPGGGDSMGGQSPPRGIILLTTIHDDVDDRQQDSEDNSVQLCAIFATLRTSAQNAQISTTHYISLESRHSRNYPQTITPGSPFGWGTHSQPPKFRRKSWYLLKFPLEFYSGSEYLKRRFLWKTTNETPSFPLQRRAQVAKFCANQSGSVYPFTTWMRVRALLFCAE